MRPFACLVFLFSAAVPALAQDLGAQWVDRITSELGAEKAPLSEGSQFTYGAQGGVLYVYDSNVFLTEKNKVGDSIWIPYARANVEYAEPKWEVSGDFEANYKSYVESDGARDDEERFIARVVYAGSAFGGSLVQMLRNESDPLDATFADRVARFVSDTIPRLYWDLNPVLTVEVEGQIEVVRFKEKTFSGSNDNENYRMALALVYKSPWNLDFVVQGGAYFVHYIEERDVFGDPTSPPDVQGWFARGGVRGDVTPDLYIEALAGITQARTDIFDFVTKPARDGVELATMDASVTARWKVVDRVNVNAGFTRQIGFASGQDPFQVVNNFTVLVDFLAMEQVTIRARAQYGKADSVLGVHRTFSSVSAIATYKVLEHIVVDGGVTGRFGHVDGDVGNSLTYNDLVFQLGVGVAW